MTDNLDKPVKQWCEKHWAPIGEGSMKGELNGMYCAIKLMEVFVRNETILRKLGWNPETGEKADANPAIMNAIMAEHSPLCCFLGDEVINKIMTLAKKYGATSHKLSDDKKTCLTCSCSDSSHCHKPGCIHCASPEDLRKSEEL